MSPALAPATEYRPSEAETGEADREPEPVRARVPTERRRNLGQEGPTHERRRGHHGDWLQDGKGRPPAPAGGGGGGGGGVGGGRRGRGGRSEEQAQGGEAPIVEELIPAERDPLRVHEGGARRPVLEDVVLEDIVVREHVVQPVANVPHHVAADEALRRRLDVEAVAHVRHLVAQEAEADGIPDVDAGALLSRITAGDAPYRATLHRARVRLAQVHTEEPLPDAAVADRGPCAGHVDPGRVAPEVAPPPAVDVEALDDDVVGADAHDAPGTRADEQRPAPSDEPQRLVDEEGAFVAPRSPLPPPP